MQRRSMGCRTVTARLFAGRTGCRIHQSLRTVVAHTVAHSRPGTEHRVTVAGASQGVVRTRKGSWVRPHSGMRWEGKVAARASAAVTRRIGTWRRRRREDESGSGRYRKD